MSYTWFPKPTPTFDILHFKPSIRFLKEISFRYTSQLFEELKKVFD